jgi:hypothetical protein
MQSILTVAVAAVALYIMAHPADPSDAQKWAQNAITFMSAIGFADGRFANI